MVDAVVLTVDQLTTLRAVIQRWLDGELPRHDDDIDMVLDLLDLLRPPVRVVVEAYER